MNYKKAFTLIELLVVVLIIGILTAIALPQYQKTVEKSKSTQALILLKAIEQSYLSYYLANATYATKFNELDIEIPFTGNTPFLTYDGATDTLSNSDWSVQIENTQYYKVLIMARISGPYKGAYFYITYFPDTSNGIRCAERKSTNVAFTFEKNEGDYCHDIIQGTFLTEDQYARSYEIN